MIYKWWHVFVRKRTKPIPPGQAILWKRRLDILYAFLAWNAFGLVIYNFYKGKADWAQYYGLKNDEGGDTRPGHAWANVLGIKNATVYRISGFQKVDEYNIVDGEVSTSKTSAKEEDKEKISLE